jgi:hypothetical protein
MKTPCSLLLLLSCLLNLSFISHLQAMSQSRHVPNRVLLAFSTKKKLNSLMTTINEIYESAASNNLQNITTEKTLLLQQDLDKLLKIYVFLKKTKNMPSSEILMKAPDIQTFVDAYNKLITVGISVQQNLPILLDETDFETMNNTNLIGALLYIPEMTVKDFNQVITARIMLANAAKNIENNAETAEAICANISTDEQLDYLTISKPFASFGFATEEDMQNKAVIDMVCGE